MARRAKTTCSVEQRRSLKEEKQASMGQKSGSLLPALRFQWFNQWNSRLDRPIRQKSPLLILVGIDFNKHSELPVTTFQLPVITSCQLPVISNQHFSPPPPHLNNGSVLFCSLKLPDSFLSILSRGMVRMFLSTPCSRSLRQQPIVSSSGHY